MILKDSDGIEFVYKTAEGKEISVVIPTQKIIDLCEDKAFEEITQPECGESSCAVNGFCECDPINEDAELQYIKVSVD
jgi:hypothetical protein